jgi:hypothetical protein
MGANIQNLPPLPSPPANAAKKGAASSAALAGTWKIVTLTWHTIFWRLRRSLRSGATRKTSLEATGISARAGACW